MSDGREVSLGERLAVLQLQMDNLKQQMQEGRAADRLLVDQQLRSLRDTMVAIATKHETFAPSAALEKLDGRVGTQDQVITAIDKKVVPREEVQARFDGVAAKQDGIINSLNQLSQLVTKLAEEMSAAESSGRLEEARGNERRNRLVAVIATGTAIASLVFSSFVHHGGGTNTVYVPAPVTTTTNPGHP